MLPQHYSVSIYIIPLVGFFCINRKIDERSDFIYIKENVTANRRIHIFEKYDTTKMSYERKLKVMFHPEHTEISTMGFL